MIIRMDCNDTISLFPPAVAPVPTWSQWMRLGMRKAWQDIRGVGADLANWNQRRVERHLLLTLDDRMLKDIGISRANAWAEAIKPMWRS